MIKGFVFVYLIILKKNAFSRISMYFPGKPERFSRRRSSCLRVGSILKARIYFHEKASISSRNTCVYVEIRGNTQKSTCFLMEICLEIILRAVPSVIKILFKSFV